MAIKKTYAIGAHVVPRRGVRELKLPRPHARPLLYHRILYRVRELKFVYVGGRLPYVVCRTLHRVCELKDAPRFSCHEHRVVPLTGCGN